MRSLIPIVVVAGALLGAVVSQVAFGAPAAQGPAIPHEVEGREACLVCHGTGTLAMPEDHAGRGEETCLACHQAASAAPAEETASAPGATTGPTVAPPTRAPVPTLENPAPTVGPTLEPILPEEYRGPAFCSQPQCHVPHLQEWQGSTHAEAFQDPVFQQSWVDNQQPGYCLKCHATGYNPNTGLPVAEGVTCESCHGTYRQDHPRADMMPVDAAAERCGVCHTTTYDEWQLSGHAARGVKCASCHAVHSQGLLFATSTALCATCHGDRYEDFAHAGHAEHQVTCADCHMYRPPDGSMREGLLPTGHFFAVTSDACTQCHTRDSIHSRREEFVPASQPDVPTMQRITVLEEEVAQLQSSAARNLILGLVGGVLGGLLIGVIATVLLRRRAAGGRIEAQSNP